MITGEQEVQRKLQSDNWGGLPYKRGLGRRSISYYAGINLFPKALDPRLKPTSSGTQLVKKDSNH